jgi:hypothetical protein
MRVTAQLKMLLNKTHKTCHYSRKQQQANKTRAGILSLLLKGTMINGFSAGNSVSTAELGTLAVCAVPYVMMEFIYYAYIKFHTNMYSFL